MSILIANKIEGYSKIYDLKKNDDVDLIFRKEKMENKTIVFSAFVKTPLGNRAVGHITIDRIRYRKNGTFGSELSDTKENIKFYGERNYLYIGDLSSYKNKIYKGVGTALIQCAVEYSLKKKYNGQIVVEAVRDSHVFYYKLGFRSENQTINDKIMHLIKEPPDHYQELGNTILYLDVNNNDLWKQKLALKRIFS